MPPDDVHAMTVGELRQLIAHLPDDEYIFVDGYEGGYDMPRLTRTCLETLEPWVCSRDYTGPWSATRGSGGVPVWVLERA